MTEHGTDKLMPFVRALTHEFKSPVNTLLMVMSELADELESTATDDVRQLLARGMATVDRATLLVDDMSAYARLAGDQTPLSVEEIDLDLMAKSVLEDLDHHRTATSEGPSADVSVGKLPTVDADPAQVRVLLQNLISNAIKFHKPGNRPRVSITGGINDLNQVWVNVSDTGIGISPADAERVFEPFTRLNNRSDFPGTGLGLALCRRVVDNHGGHIELQSQPGEGTTVTVLVPVGTS